MTLNLTLFDVETLIYKIDKEIYCREANKIASLDLRLIKKKIEVQIENYKENLIDELKRQYRAGEIPSVASLQRQEGFGYSRAAMLIEQAKADVEKERRFKAEYRKEQNNG